MRASLAPAAPEAIRHHFQSINDAIRRIERMRVEAEPKHLDALLKFAERAYRRPLSQTEREKMLAYYNTIRQKDGLTHEEEVMQAPSVQKRFFTSCAWLCSLSTEVLGSRPMRAVPIS